MIQVEFQDNVSGDSDKLEGPFFESPETDDEEDEK